MGDRAWWWVEVLGAAAFALIVPLAISALVALVAGRGDRRCGPRLPAPRDGGGVRSLEAAVPGRSGDLRSPRAPGPTSGRTSSAPCGPRLFGRVTPARRHSKLNGADSPEFARGKWPGVTGCNPLFVVDQSRVKAEAFILETAKTGPTRWARPAPTGVSGAARRPGRQSELGVVIGRERLHRMFERSGPWRGACDQRNGVATRASTTRPSTRRYRTNDANERLATSFSIPHTAM
jgi:hypothetical protein